MTLALVEFVFGERPIGALSNRVHIDSKREIAHRRVAGDDDFVNRPRIALHRFNRVTQVSHQRALQQSAALLRVVMDAGHDVGAGESLRVFKRLHFADFAVFEVHQTVDEALAALDRRDKVFAQEG